MRCYHLIGKNVNILVSSHMGITIEFQIKQASHAIAFYYELLNIKPNAPNSTIIATTKQKDNTQPDTLIKERSFAKKESIVITGVIKPMYPQKDPWESVYNDLNSEIKVRHYSPKTLKTYSEWLRNFQRYTKSKSLESLDDSDIKGFLTFLAVQKNVSASTQNQAFNALLFFYRHILKKEPGDLRDTIRAKIKLYIPVVLSREEVDRIINNLIVKLLYGCGLRAARP
ncbi:MAG: phage integrase N-terminal SAM-like domain-containing protein [Desulfobacterales bacterium]|nr:phage integrase N-terminal SAM-like domain-containing protein [Desulfobacterales bacterium]